MTTPPPAATPPSDTAAALPELPAVRVQRRWWPWLRWPVKILLGLLSLLFTAVLLLALAAWVWGGHEGSLANTLQVLQKVGVLSRVEGVRGTLARGGQVQQLEAQFGSTHIRLEGLQLAWQAPALLQGQLHIENLSAAKLRIDSGPSEPSPPHSASAAPRSLALPISVQLDALKVGEVALYLAPETAKPSWQAQNIQGHYQYGQGQHRAAITSLAMLGGQYQAQASVHAQRPFALQAQAQAQLQLPDMPQAPPLVASLQASGSLLDIQAHLLAQTQALPPSPSAAKPSPVAAGSSAASSADIRARIQPWSALMVQSLQGQVNAINLATFWPTLPQTRISGSLLPQLAGLSKTSSQDKASTQGNTKSTGDTLDIDLRNSAAAPWDAGGLPLERVQGQLHWQGGQLDLPNLTLSAGSGRVHLQGQWQAGSGAWQAKAELLELDLARLHSAFASSRLQGDLSAHSPAPEGKTAAAPIDFALQAQNLNPASKTTGLLDVRSAKLQGSWQEGALDLPELQLETSDAKLQGSANYHSAAARAQLDVQLQAPGFSGQAKGQISAQSGQGQMDLALNNAQAFSTWLGRWPGIALPSVAGQAQGQASWQGGWKNPQLQVRLDAPELRLVSVQEKTVKMPKDGADAATAAPENAADLRLSQVQIQAQGPLTALQLGLQGNWQQGTHLGRADVQAQLKLQTQSPLRLELQTSRLELAVSDRATPLAAGWQLAQAAPIQLQWQSGRSQLAAGKLRLTAPQALRVGVQRSLLLEWNESELQQGASGGIARAHSSGQLLGLSHTWLEALSGASLADMGLAGEILLDARWDVRLDEHLRIDAGITRKSGDFYLSHHQEGLAQRSNATTPSAGADKAQQRAGLRDVYLKISGNDQELRLQTLWDSEHAGRVQANLSSSLSRSAGTWSWPESSPVRGQVQADLPTLGLWSALAPTGWRVAGTMALKADISGTRLAPDLRGQFELKDLAMRSVLDGVELKNGQLLARFAGTRMDLERFRIEGAEGDLQASGKLAWEAGQPSMDIRLVAARLRASNRPDRRLTVSGQVQAGLQGQRITLQGQLAVDEALILLADSNKPSLGDDVRIVRRQQQSEAANTVPSEAQLAAAEAAAKAASAQALAPFAQAAPTPAWALDAAVALDMGKNFRVRGLGLDTRLAGTIQIQTVSQQTTSKGQAGLRPEIVGTLRTVGGEYRAYGQWLEIEEGLIRFTGPYNNPQLDILAIRPRTEERVGVRITGPASNPRAALYSENAMPDSEKLAWLILGREGSNGGAEAAMLQQAAVALLGSGSNSGGLAQSIGLDEIGYRSAETNSDGTVRESSISIGKRLSRNLYLSYERSLSGALGTLFVFYDISRRFTLRAQTNEQASALDIIFTRRYQSLLPTKRAALDAAAAQERTEQIEADAARHAVPAPAGTPAPAQAPKPLSSPGLKNQH